MRFYVCKKWDGDGYPIYNEQMEEIGGCLRLDEDQIKPSIWASTNIPESKLRYVGEESKRRRQFLGDEETFEVWETIPDRVWKITITFEGYSEPEKRKFYENEKEFNRWYSTHIKRHEPYGYSVRGFVLKDNLWQAIDHPSL